MKARIAYSLLALLCAAPAGAAAQQPPEAGEAVLGLTFRGRHQAYPLRLFSQMRVVNDVVGREEVVVFHDPERDLSCAYVRTVHGEPIEFAAAARGTLAEDLTTVTRWDMTTGEAVAGNLVGQRLIAIPLRRTSWGEWKAAHPDALVYTAARPPSP